MFQKNISESLYFHVLKEYELYIYIISVRILMFIQLSIWLVYTNFCGKFHETLSLFQTSKVTDRSFRGCLDNLVYQSQEINLWVAQSSGTSSRTCCQSPPALPSTPTVTGISFSGFGYISFSPGSLELSDIMQVSLEFRTFSTSATILSISSADSRTVYSVLIVSGLVVWVINVDGVQIRLQSQTPYATGRWAQVRWHPTPCNKINQNHNPFY